VSSTGREVNVAQTKIARGKLIESIKEKNIMEKDQERKPGDTQGAQGHGVR